MAHKPIKSMTVSNREKVYRKIAEEYHFNMSIQGSQKTAVMKHLAKKYGYRTINPVYSAIEWAASNTKTIPA